MIEELKFDNKQCLPLREEVLIRLRQAILQGEFQPGERLMEMRLAQQMGVSRTPVRDAIKKLEVEGLVTMIPRRGAEVASITHKDMKEVLELRATLEDFAVELCCERIRPKDIEELEKANRVFSAAVHSGELLTIAEADVKFHDIIYKITGNRRLLQIINNLREQIYRYRFEYIKNEKARLTLIDEHEAIIRHLEKGDVTGAKKAIREHITNQENDIARAISEHMS